ADVPLLAEHFLGVARAKYPTSRVSRFAPDAIDRLVAYRWPGNVRELAHLVERHVLLGTDAEIRAADLPAHVRTPAAPDLPSFDGPVVPMRDLQRRYARWAMEQLGGRRMRVAEALGIDKKTLSRWLAPAGDGDEPAGEEPQG
ncbi:MAG TPA: sigma-54-dependent Fis family transcriptional regulator, partial [Minicystis sp.]|nr:sigma-54-dependent Fis family transcriptional regulator [Minicystis sp.]